MPTTATMSSVHSSPYPAAHCIDGSEDGGTCQTQQETAPWMALDYGNEVQVGSVVLMNRINCCYYKTKNVNVRVSSTLPESSSEMFTGGQLLGTFVGPGTVGQRIEITGSTQLTGRYVVVQMDFTSEASEFNLNEVTAWSNGKISYSTLYICFFSSSSLPSHPVFPRG